MLKIHKLGGGGACIFAHTNWSSLDLLVFSTQLDFDFQCWEGSTAWSDYLQSGPFKILLFFCLSARTGLFVNAMASVRNFRTDLFVFMYMWSQL